MADFVIVWDEAALAELKDTPQVRLAADRLVAQAVTTMKSLCPVSPVMPVYASPVPLGSSQGPVYKGRGLARPKGPDVPRTRYPGDLPLPASGTLRNSIRGTRLEDGTMLVGPTADYGAYVNDGTPPHEINSTGPWPLRNRATGQVFGPHVHHPGTKGAHFIEATAEALNGTVIRA